MGYTFNPPPGWDVPAGFTPDSGWKPDPLWPPAPQGWQFWLPEAAPQQPAKAKVSGMFKSLKAKADDEDWMGKAKAAATQATASAQQMAGQATEKSRQMDQASLDKQGPMPEGALWRGISHDAGRNAVVTLYPDRIERVKQSGHMSVTGMLTGGFEDVEVIPTKSISSVQVKRGAWYHDVTVYASGNTIVLSVDAAAAEQLRGLIMNQVAGGSSSPPAPSPAAPQPAAPSIVEQIKQLGELRDAGLISAQEFEAKKADLLARM
jgi:hypothetical protein